MSTQTRPASREIRAEDVYTHRRVAGILGRPVESVLANMVRPATGPKVSSRQIGEVHVMSGEAIMQWIEASWAEVVESEGRRA